MDNWTKTIFEPRKLTKSVMFWDGIPQSLLANREIKLAFDDKNAATLVELAHKDAEYVGCNHWEFPENYIFPAEIQELIQ